MKRRNFLKAVATIGAASVLAPALPVSKKGQSPSSPLGRELVYRSGYIPDLPNFTNPTYSGREVIPDSPTFAIPPHVGRGFIEDAKSLVAKQKAKASL